MKDKWDWSLLPGKGYYARVVYHSLRLVMQLKILKYYDTLWKKNAPLKVSSLTWRLLLKQFPVRDSLICYGIIPQTSYQCVCDCGQCESANHMFVGCDFYGSIWMHLRIWLDIQATNKLPILDHFQHFTYLAGNFKKSLCISTCDLVRNCLEFGLFKMIKISTSFGIQIKDYNNDRSRETCVV